MPWVWSFSNTRSLALSAMFRVKRCRQVLAAVLMRQCGFQSLVLVLWRRLEPFFCPASFLYVRLA